jgi:hypothetical protein
MSIAAPMLIDDAGGIEQVPDPVQRAAAAQMRQEVLKIRGVKCKSPPARYLPPRFSAANSQLASLSSTAFT